MSRILTVSNKLLSLRGRVCITDADDRDVYHAQGELAFLSPTWRLYEGGAAEGPPLATIRRRLLAWVPTWDIEAGGMSFQIKRKVFSWTRQYDVVGGDYDGATIRGNIWDLNFAITHHCRELATAAGKLLSLRDRHRVEIVGEGEHFVVIALLVLQLDRRSERANDGD